MNGQNDKETERQRYRGIERQRDRETERQRDRETERQRDRETERDRETDTLTDRGKERQKERQTGGGETERKTKLRLSTFTLSKVIPLSVITLSHSHSTIL